MERKLKQSHTEVTGEMGEGKSRVAGRSRIRVRMETGSQRDGAVSPRGDFLVSV